jgi:hypothetical protein
MRTFVTMVAEKGIIPMWGTTSIVRSYVLAPETDREGIVTGVSKKTEKPIKLRKPEKK